MQVAREETTKKEKKRKGNKKKGGKEKQKRREGETAARRGGGASCTYGTRDLNRVLPNYPRVEEEKWAGKKKVNKIKEREGRPCPGDE